MQLSVLGFLVTLEDPPFGKCPVQIEGQMGGFDIYFRARGTHWRLEISTCTSHAIIFQTRVRYCEEVERFAAGYISTEVALNLLTVGLTQFIEQHYSQHERLQRLNP